MSDDGGLTQIASVSQFLQAKGGNVGPADGADLVPANCVRARTAPGPLAGRLVRRAGRTSVQSRPLRRTISYWRVLSM
jgi:hypothetical protein